jgi:hypothetical protein
VTNEQNVIALASLIKQVGLPTPRGAQDTGWFNDADYHELAESLAELGVLVPSGLTDEQVHSFAADRGQHFDEMEPEEFAQVRETLARIAKGE